MRRRFGCLVLAATCTACAVEPAPPAPQRLSVADILGADTAGGERALLPRSFSFPGDHGSHPSFATEWWYFTGNLRDANDRRFGYQLTFFRISLPTPGARLSPASAWDTDQLWMGHFAVTDVAQDRFFAFERFERGAVALAGADPAPWRVWINDWTATQTSDTSFPVRLRAGEGTADGGDGGDVVAIDLTLSPRKPIVLQGDRGLSRKGPTPGNASYYYSLSRLQTTGVVRIGDTEYDVEGSSWLDREWSTGALEDNQIGWDWFALHLDDGRELMFYQLRERDGGASPFSSGVLIGIDGIGFPLGLDDVHLVVEDSWHSPVDGSEYPAAWRMDIAAHGLSLRITPRIAAQELNLAFRYWEGTVSVEGTATGGASVSGSGYVELTGYAGGGPPP